MPRDRLATQELQGVLDLLDEVQQASAKASHEQHALRPPKLGEAKVRATTQNKLFAPVKIEGEDALGRATGEEKLAMLRKKVRALEDRLREVEDAWNTRDGELEQAKLDTTNEKQLRDEAEQRIDKLNAFLRDKKKEIDAYHQGVQEALREQARREQLMQERAERAEQAERDVQEALREQARREEEARRDYARREDQAQRDYAQREQQLHKRVERAELAEHDVQEALLEQARREAEALRDFARREEDAQREHARRVAELEVRATEAEEGTREVIERQKYTPPPPPLLTEGDIAELHASVATAGRIIAKVLKGELRDSEQTAALRAAYQGLRQGFELLKAVKKDMA